MNTFEKIGDHIQAKREAKGMTQDELADALGVSKSTISLYESGGRKPTFDRMTQIAQLLDTPVSEFLDLDAPRKEKSIETTLRAEGLSREDIKKIRNYIEISWLKNSGRKKQYIIHLTPTEYTYIRDIIATQEIELDSLVDKKINPHAKTIKSIAKHFLE